MAKDMTVIKDTDLNILLEEGVFTGNNIIPWPRVIMKNTITIGLT